MSEIDPHDLARALAQIPLFREIQKVLASSSGAVNWEIANQVAHAVAEAGGPGVPADSSDIASITEASRKAGLYAPGASGLAPSPRDPAIEVVGRAQWAAINLVGLAPLIERTAAKLTGRFQESASQELTSLPVPGLSVALAPLGAFLVGLQVGFLTGYLSRRVLGQYDICFPTEGDRLLFVFPNIVEVERGLEFDPEQFRLWLAVHEVTHRLQFESVEWARSYYVGLVERYIDAGDIDSGEVVSRLQGLGDPERLGHLMQHPDELLPMMMTPGQEGILSEIQAFMSVLEGHAEWSMNAVGAKVLGDYEKMREATNRRRATRSSAERLLQGLLGLDLKIEQYRAGQKFIETIADAGQLKLLFDHSDNLPRLEEINEPHRWLSRVAFS